MTTKCAAGWAAHPKEVTRQADGTLGRHTSSGSQKVRKIREGRMGRYLALVACAAVLALAPGRSDAAQTYKVKKGDSLHRIARTFHVDVDELKEANGLQSTNIQPGTKIKIPKHASKSGAEEKRPRKAEARSEAKEKKPGSSKGSDSQAESDAKAVSHVVKKGETLHAIAEAFDIPVKDLQRLNGMGKKSKLKPGMTLVLKSGERGRKVASAHRTEKKTYVVRKGDNIYKIAKKFHVAASELKRMNGLKSDSLRVGKTLVVEERVVAQKEDDSDDGITECKLDEAKISADLQEYSAEAREEGEDPSITDRMMRVAKKMLGIPYRFGGNTTRGIDCSAYVQKVFRFLNLPLPRTAREQYAVGREVPKDSLETGDLVFFRTYARYPSHVGIYLGDSKFIHASSRGKKVSIDSLDTPFYSKRFIGAKRLVQEDVDEGKPEAAASGETAG